MTSTVHPVAGTTAWRSQAACRESDTRLFYPTGRNPDCGPATAICRTCPVVDACLQHAIDHREHHGIWGGRTPDERRRLARTRAPRPYYVLPRDPDGTGGGSRFTTWATRPDITDQKYRAGAAARTG